jgi:hypothetical protein
VLVNIFGGIAKCDVIAAGIVAAAQETHLGVPLVVRLEGTNVEIGRKMLNDSGMKIVTAATIDEAATKVVARLHRARISWRSMKAKHFYPEDIGGNRWRIWLIDCEGVYRWASRRDCEREWAREASQTDPGSAVWPALTTQKKTATESQPIAPAWAVFLKLHSLTR